MIVATQDATLRLKIYGNLSLNQQNNVSILLIAPLLLFTIVKPIRTTTTCA